VTDDGDDDDDADDNDDDDDGVSFMKSFPCLLYIYIWTW